MLRTVRQIVLVLALVASGFALMNATPGCGFNAFQNSCSVEHLSAAPAFDAGGVQGILPEPLQMAAVIGLAALLLFLTIEPIAKKTIDLTLHTQRHHPRLPKRITDILSFSPQLSAVRDF